MRALAACHPRTRSKAARLAQTAGLVLLAAAGACVPPGTAAPPTESGGRGGTSAVGQGGGGGGSSVDGGVHDLAGAAGGTGGTAGVGGPSGSGGSSGSGGATSGSFDASSVDVTGPAPDTRPVDAPPVVDMSPAPEPKPDAAAPDVVIDDGLIPLFVAQGVVGRTTVSCDDGRTWVANHDDDPNVRCNNPTDCGHAGNSGRGIAYGNGWFVATFGWGVPGDIRRSRDGEIWEKVIQDTWFAGIAFGSNVFVVGERPPWIANPDGSNWRRGSEPNFQAMVRRIAFLPQGGGGVFVIFGNDPGNDMVLSSDGAATWWRPTTRPPECTTDMGQGGMAAGGGVMLIVNHMGVACRSTDGGKNWTPLAMGGFVNGQVVWSGSEFMTYGERGLYRSRDGLTWTTQQTSPPDLFIGPITISDGGTFVAAKDAWMEWYDKQEFYRSRDGVNWEVLPKTAFVPSHPIAFIASGRGKRPAACK